MTNTTKHIAVLPGDGIGPEVTREGVKLLEQIARQFDYRFDFQTAQIGGVAIDDEGTPLPKSTVRACKESDAVLLGAVGGPKWDKNLGGPRPEAGLLGIRQELSLFANLRPITLFDSLVNASTLKSEVISGVDILILRELTSGLYFGKPRGRRQGALGLEVVDTLYYSEQEIARIVRLGFETAKARRKKLTSVDKANVLESSRLWREIVDKMAGDYPEVQVNHLLVDNAAMQLVRDPRQFDVIVTENMFGDILSDEAAMITGSIGMLPSASLSQSGPGLYEPCHGSAPDIAGKGLANPLATMLSVAMMLRHSFGYLEAAESVEQAVKDVLLAGYRTKDIAASSERALSTTEMGDKVRQALK